MSLTRSSVALCKVDFGRGINLGGSLQEDVTPVRTCRAPCSAAVNPTALSSALLAAQVQVQALLQARQRDTLPLESWSSSSVPPSLAESEQLPSPACGALLWRFSTQASRLDPDRRSLGPARAHLARSRLKTHAGCHMCSIALPCRLGISPAPRRSLLH